MCEASKITYRWIFVSEGVEYGRSALVLSQAMDRLVGIHQCRLGHLVQQFLEYYTHQDDSDRKGLCKRWERHFASSRS